MKFLATCLLGAVALVWRLGCGGDDSGPPPTGVATGGGSGGTAGSGGSMSTGSAGASVNTTGNGGASGAAGAGTSMGGAGGAAGSPDGGSGGASGTTDAGKLDAGDAKSSDADASSPSDAKTDVTTNDAAPYEPCPPKGTPCIIMPVGDSITQGAGSSDGGGYRAPLFHLAHTNLQTITFVGSGADGPAMVDGVAFPRNHEGHSGYNIDATQGRSGVSPFFPGAIMTYKPHIVLLMIGTNDVDTGEDNIPGRLGNLMDLILGPDPKLLLVVAQIVPQQQMMPDALNMKVQAFNAAIPALVKTRTDAGKHVAIVDMYGAFTANPNYSTALLTDRLHPNPAGYGVMANTWYAAIHQYLR